MSFWKSTSWKSTSWNDSLMRVIGCFKEKDKKKGEERRIARQKQTRKREFFVFDSLTPYIHLTPSAKACFAEVVLHF